MSAPLPYVGEQKARDAGRLISHAELLAILSLNETTGVFTWRHDGRYTKAGALAGWLADPTGAQPYWCIGIAKVRYQRHRLVWFWTTGEWPSGEIDHRDGMPGHDWFDNLRLADHAEQMSNRSVMKNNKLGVKGVHRRPSGRFRAAICLAGKRVTIGEFDRLEEAAAAYAREAALHYGEFASTRVAR